MRTDVARQRQQALCDFDIHLRDGNILRDGSPLVAALDIRAEAPALQRNAVAELLRAFARLFPARLPELLRVAAVRIIRTSDEGAEASAAERKPPVPALGA